MNTKNHEEIQIINNQFNALFYCRLPPQPILLIYSKFSILILDFNMISSNLIETVRACAKDFGVKSVWLFGSALGDEDKAIDIDLAVEGLVPEKFFDFYGRLFFELPKPVDLVDMEQEQPITAIIRSSGVRIYER